MSRKTVWFLAALLPLLVLPGAGSARNGAGTPEFNHGSLGGPGMAMPGTVAKVYRYQVAAKGVSVLRLRLVLMPQMRLMSNDHGLFRQVNGQTVALMKGVNNLYTNRTRGFRFSLWVKPNAGPCKCLVRIVETARTGVWVKKSTDTFIYTHVPLEK